MLQLLEKSVHDLVSLARAQRLGQSWTDARRQIPKWAQGPRGTERVTRTDQHPHVVRQQRSDRCNQAGLADARFAMQQHDRAGSGRSRASRVQQYGQLLITLQQASRHASDGMAETSIGALSPWEARVLPSRSGHGRHRRGRLSRHL